MAKKDENEYGFEGEMVRSQLKGIMMNSKQLHDLLKPDTDLPEWVQSKITLAYDYIQTASDYMATELDEDVSAPTNNAGSGNIKGIGVGPGGEPGVTAKQMNKYKKNNQSPMRRKTLSDFTKGK